MCIRDSNRGYQSNYDNRYRQNNNGNYNNQNQTYRRHVNYVSTDDRDMGRHSYQGRMNYNGNWERNFQEENNQRYRDEHRRSRSCDDDRCNRNIVTFNNNDPVKILQAMDNNQPSNNQGAQIGRINHIMVEGSQEPNTGPSNEDDRDYSYDNIEMYGTDPRWGNSIARFVDNFNRRNPPEKHNCRTTRSGADAEHE